MNNIDFESDLKQLVSYRTHLIESQDHLGIEMEEITGDIIKKQAEDGKIDKEDFVSLEEKSFLVGFYQQEIVKATAAIKNSFRLSLSAGVKVDLGEMQKALDEAIYDSISDFQMYVEKDGSVKFKDITADEELKKMCDFRVSQSSLEDRFSMLKAQYDAFLKIKEERNERAEADS